MENASNALLMAGGMLLAIIVITILVITYNGIVGFENSKIEQQTIQKVTEFNEPLMSYNKKVMYGTDLISVLNLALNNNKKYNVTTNNEEYYVDISFTLINDLSNITELYSLDTQSGVYNKSIESTNKVIDGNRTYKISVDKEIIVNKIINKLSEKEQTTLIDPRDKVNGILMRYKIVSNSVYDLKRKTFTCTNVEKDSEGKIKLMEFKQKSSQNS